MALGDCKDIAWVFCVIGHPLVAWQHLFGWRSTWKIAARPAPLLCYLVLRFGFNQIREGSYTPEQLAFALCRPGTSPDTAAWARLSDNQN
jgi:hypothetical protein